MENASNYSHDLAVYRYRNLCDSMLMEVDKLKHPSTQYDMVNSDYFMQLYRRDLPLNEKGDPAVLSNRWKLHVTMLKEDVQKAWDALLPVLMEEGVPLFKIAHPKNLDYFDNPISNDTKQALQAGKFFTIYIPDNLENPCRLLSRIETTLKNAGVRKNTYKIAGDEKIRGSDFITYCNDGITKYVNSAERYAMSRLEQFNPDSHGDPFKYFSVASDAKNLAFDFGYYPDLYYGKSNNGYIEPAMIKSDEIDKPLWVIRTIPGKFSHEQLKQQQAILSTHDIDSKIRFSNSAKASHGIENSYYLCVKDIPDSITALYDVSRGKLQAKVSPAPTPNFTAIQENPPPPFANFIPPAIAAKAPDNNLHGATTPLPLHPVIFAPSTPPPAPSEMPFAQHVPFDTANASEPPQKMHTDPKALISPAHPHLPAVTHKASNLELPSSDLVGNPPMEGIAATDTPDIRVLKAVPPIITPHMPDTPALAASESLPFADAVPLEPNEPRAAAPGNTLKPDVFIRDIKPLPPQSGLQPDMNLDNPANAEDEQHTPDEKPKDPPPQKPYIYTSRDTYIPSSATSPTPENKKTSNGSLLLGGALLAGGVAAMAASGKKKREGDKPQSQSVFATVASVGLCAIGIGLVAYNLYQKSHGRA